MKNIMYVGLIKLGLFLCLICTPVFALDLGIVNQAGNNLAVGTNLEKTSFETEVIEVYSSSAEEMQSNFNPEEKDPIDYLLEDEAFWYSNPKGHRGRRSVPETSKETIEMMESLLYYKEDRDSLSGIETDNYLMHYNTEIMIFYRKDINKPCVYFDFYRKKVYFIESEVYVVDLDDKMMFTGEMIDVNSQKKVLDEVAVEIKNRYSILLEQDEIKIIFIQAKACNEKLVENLSFFEESRSSFQTDRIWEWPFLKDIPKEKLITAKDEKSGDKAMFLPADENVRYIGDLHGDFTALEFILNKRELEKNPEIRYVFLGDYVDRGPDGLRILIELVKLKKQYPDRVFLLKGNHELEEMNFRDGFLKDLKREYGTRRGLDLWKEINEGLFEELPLFLVVEDGTFVVHGNFAVGIIDGNKAVGIANLKYLLATDKFKKQLLWNDPLRKGEIEKCKVIAEGLYSSQRDFHSEGCFKVQTNLIDDMEFNLIIRAHEAVSYEEKGVFSKVTGEERCVTVFSSGLPSRVTSYRDVENPFTVVVNHKERLEQKDSLKEDRLLCVSFERIFTEIDESKTALLNKFIRFMEASTFKIFKETYDPITPEELYKVLIDKAFCFAPYVGKEIENFYAIEEKLLYFFESVLDERGLLGDFLIEFSKKLKLEDFKSLQTLVCGNILELINGDKSLTEAEKVEKFSFVFENIPENLIENFQNVSEDAKAYLESIQIFVEEVVSLEKVKGSIISFGIITAVGVPWDFKNAGKNMFINEENIDLSEEITEDFMKVENVRIFKADKSLGLVSAVQSYYVSNDKFIIFVDSDSYSFADYDEDGKKALFDFQILCEQEKIKLIKANQAVRFLNKTFLMLEQGEITREQYNQEVKFKLKEFDALVVKNVLFQLFKENRLDSLIIGIEKYYTGSQLREDADSMVSSYLDIIEKYDIEEVQEGVYSNCDIKSAILKQMVENFKETIKDSFSSEMRRELKMIEWYFLEEGIQENLTETIIQNLVDIAA
jgi:hypothetical protein